MWQGGSATQALRLVQAGKVAHLTTWKGSSIYLDRWLRWDWTRFTLAGSLIDAVQTIETDAVGPAMDKYLWGIAEVPASFPAEALKAQAVAARTYAAKRAGRVLMPTPADQNYTGWKKETEGTGGVWGAKWKAAVDATNGVVVATAGGGPLIDAFYSSSMGGHTEDERYVWGVEAPFLRAVDDSRWDLASSNPAQMRSWAKAFTWSQVASRLGFSQVSALSVAQRGSDARVAGVKVTGIKQGQLQTTYVEGWDVREAFGLLSPGFTISTARTGGAGAQPLAGDWDGDGVDQPGWFRNGRVSLAMTGSSGSSGIGLMGQPVPLRHRGRRGGRRRLGRRRRRRPRRLPQRHLAAAQRVRRRRRADDHRVRRDRRQAGRRLVERHHDGDRRRPRHQVAAARHRHRRTDPALLPLRAGVRRAGGRALEGDGAHRDRRGTRRAVAAAQPALRRPRRASTVTFGAAAGRPVTGDWAGTGRTSVGMVRDTTFRLRATLAERSAVQRRIFVG